MVYGDTQLAKNIKFLRTAYGESQLDLALAIGLDSSNTIANYEKGTRNPKSDIKKKLAQHYRITGDELTYADFSDLHFPNLEFDNKEKMMNNLLLYLPIICTEKAMEDSMFKQGYESQMQVFNTIATGCACNDSDFETSIDSYGKSKIPESLANTLWYFLICEIGAKTSWIIKIAKAQKEHRFNNKDFYKCFYLKDFSDLDEEHLPDGLNHNDLEVLETEILNLLKELKTYAEWSDLVDYYIAIRYVFGCVSNKKTNEMNSMVGEEMMWAYMQMGNLYAKKFVLYGIENSKE